MHTPTVTTKNIPRRNQRRKGHVGERHVGS